MSPTGGARYRFGPRERGGSLAGWRPGQILTVAVGLVIGVLVLRGEPNVAGVMAAVCVLVLYGAMATVPVSGRTGDEWLPVVVCWAARRSRVPGGRTMGALRGVRLLRAGWQDMGVVHDRTARTLTAALSLRGRSFALLGPDEQDRRVGAWSSVLASLAREGSPVQRVQWVAASFPDDGRGAHAYLAAEAAADVTSASSASYEALLADMDSHACAHDVVLAVQVRLTKSVEVGCAALAREVASLTRLLADADVQVESVLSAEDLAHQLLRTYETGTAGAAPASASAVASAAVEDPWPMAMEETWSSVRVDGMVHATFWVAEWPRIEVRSDFLAPLLLGSARSTFAVVMEPLGSDVAVRKVEASRTADLADSELRRRGGFVSTARHARESEVLARREAELADGHASFRYAGFVTISAASEAELSTACDAVQHAAGQSRLALRRLYGDQASAYTCTLPLCRGLR
ncbi:MAG TPA: SCO6880 family protein [Acidimicrobiales bacterium]